jgi:hypothetical protein
MKFKIIKRFKNIIYLMGLSVLILVSCEKETPDILAEKDGPAVISYVRVTNPNASDSLLVSAFMGSLITIVGDNLGDTKEICFNDQKALLQPNFVTDKTIIVNVPSTVPVKVTDNMRLVFSDKSELIHPFKIRVPEPIIKGVKAEFVAEGDIMELSGDFFFNPKVIFAGGIQGTVVSSEKTKMSVRVPAGAKPGPISVQTSFGKTNSKFIFRDDRNIIVNFDDKQCETWTAAYSSQAPLLSVKPVDGVYAYFKNDKHGAWSWTNSMTMQYWAPRGRGRVPVARGNVNDLVFKMEVNVPVEWKDVRMEIFPAPYGESEGRSDSRSGIYRWQPFSNGPFKTDGWITIEIPMSEFVFNTENDNPTRKIEDISALSNFTMMSFGPANSTVPIAIAFDNLRIVPKS